MAVEFVTYRPFTIRVAVTGTLAAFAKLLDSSMSAPRGSMLGLLLTQGDFEGMPKFETRAGGKLVLEALVEEPETAEQAYARLIEELKPIGFEPAPL